MLRSYETKQLSLYSELYHRIPENHILKLINSAISFKFVNELLEKSYCKGFGRPAKEPEMMIRISFLQYLYNLSDERVLQELQVNLAYMWFIGINPDEDLPHPSLLAKFRTTRLHECDLDDIMAEIVRQCIKNGLIKEDSGVNIDTTHINANTVKKVPERIMKHLAKKIFRSMNKEDYEIPDYEQIENHAEAKEIMKDFLENVIENASEEAKLAVDEATEVLESSLFIEQKGIRSLVDKDARVGNKSKTQQFFGYKAEMMQLAESGLICSLKVENGAYVDGTNFKELFANTRKAGIAINSLYGDKAYFRKDILEILKLNKIIPYIPVSASSYKIDETLYSYNKDSDCWNCIMGNSTIKRKKETKEKRGKTFEYYLYTFEREKCRNCPKRNECIGKARTIAKKLHVSINAPEYYEHSQWAKSKEFYEAYKKRAKIEPKNAEMKRFHGLARARGYGLRSVSLQAKFTAIAVNLKRISQLISSLKPNFLINLFRSIDILEKNGEICNFHLLKN